VYDLGRGQFAVSSLQFAVYSGHLAKDKGIFRISISLINFLIMKQFFSLLIIILLTTLSLKAQDANVISTLRMGIFKLKATQSEIEKLTGQKIKRKNSRDIYLDSAKIVYNKANYILTFSKRYDENTSAPEVWELFAVSSSNTSLKTKSGIGINNTKAEILSTYDKNDITIFNDWEYKARGNAKDKIQFVKLNDFDASTTLIFETVDRIVKSIEVRIYEGE
jgi:hypothetical protein